jgi:hypothetical protein
MDGVGDCEVDAPCFLTELVYVPGDTLHVPKETPHNPQGTPHGPQAGVHVLQETRVGILLLDFWRLILQPTLMTPRLRQVPRSRISRLVFRNGKLES